MRIPVQDETNSLETTILTLKSSSLSQRTPRLLDRRLDRPRLWHLGEAPDLNTTSVYWTPNCVGWKTLSLSISPNYASTTVRELGKIVSPLPTLSRNKSAKIRVLTQFYGSHRTGRQDRDLHGSSRPCFQTLTWTRTSARTQRWTGCSGPLENPAE